jgi:hypothetical protein
MNANHVKAMPDGVTYSRAIADIKPVLPTNVSELRQLAEIFFLGKMCPQTSCGRPEAVAAIIAFGLSLGVHPAVAVNHIYLTPNGKATIWGDLPLALVRGSGLLEWITESLSGEGENLTATCTVKRRGDATSVTGKYSLGQARKAGLLNKASNGKPMPWDFDTEHMLTLRARGRLLRYVFTDVLMGVAIVEDQDPDYSPADAPISPASSGVGSSDTTNTTATTSTVVVTGVTVDAPVTEGSRAVEYATPQQLEKIKAGLPRWFVTHNWDTTTQREQSLNALRDWLKTEYGVEKIGQLRVSQADALLARLVDPMADALFGKAKDVSDPKADQAATATPSVGISGTIILSDAGTPMVLPLPLG